MATWTDHDPHPGQRPSREPLPPAPRWVVALLPWLGPVAELTDGPCVITTAAEAEAP